MSLKSFSNWDFCLQNNSIHSFIWKLSASFLVWINIFLLQHRIPLPNTTGKTNRRKSAHTNVSFYAWLPVPISSFIWLVPLVQMKIYGPRNPIIIFWCGYYWHHFFGSEPSTHQIWTIRHTCGWNWSCGYYYAIYWFIQICSHNI